MQNDSASESRRSPSPIQEPRGLSYLNANITSFSIHTDPISQRPVVPVHNPKHNQLGTFHLEHSLAANSRLNREQQHLYNRAQQTTRVDPLGPRLTYGTAIQAGMLTRPEAGEQPEEDYEEEGDMDELEEVEESREDYVRQFTHLPPIFRAEGESTSEEEENLPSYDTKFRNLIGHYNKTMGPAVKYFRNGRPPIIPPVVAKKQARANRLREHQILGRVSGPLFPHFSRVARAGMRTEKEQNDIERNKERAKIRQQEEADEQKQLEEQRRQKDRDEIYEMDRRTAEKFAQLAITPADRTTSSSNSIPIVRERRAMPPRDEVQGKIRAETREMQKCPKDGCIGDPYAVDNYNYENPLSTGIELDWPGAFETMHDSPISSRDISTFITRDDTEIFAKLDPLGTEQIRILDDFLSQMPEKVKPEDLSFVVDYSSFPQKMSNRPLETTGPSSGRPKDFRPIILDGCGVAYAYDPKFAPKWYGRTENLNYHPDKVLPVYPLVLATLRLTLLGHKIQIVLPHYYKVPYRKASKRLKVDNLYAFNKLVELELIKWLEPVNEDVDFMSLIEKLATTSCACIIGDDRVRYSYNSDKRNTYDELEDFSCYDIGEHIVDIDFLKSRRVQNFADQRYLSLQFFGDIKDMVIYDEYHEFIGADPTNHAARKEKYLRVTRETTMYYTDTQADIKRDDERRLENQLYVGEQVKLVLGLADLYALPHYELHACFIFLRFASRRGLQLNLLGEFIENHLPFPEPSEEDTTRIFPELTIEPSCLVNLDLNVDDALAQEAIDILEDGEYMDEEGWEGFHSAENTSSDS